MSLPNSILATITSQKLISHGETIIIGVSGGGDSIALLHVLNELKYKLGVKLHVAHFNHNLRKGSKADQTFVEKQAKLLSLPITTKIWPKSQQNQKGSLEERARKARISFFNALLKKEKAESIALAHTKDDLAETVLMRILRGSGLQGLRAIRPIKSLHETRDIRPFLSTSKTEILKYLKTKNIAYREDPTNKSSQFMRNKVRLKLMPLLEKEYNANIKELLCQLSHQSSVDYDYLEKQTQKLLNKYAQSNSKTTRFVIKSKVYLRQPMAIQNLLIRKMIESINGNTNKFTFRHSQEIGTFIHDKNKKKPPALPKGISIKKNIDEIVIERYTP